MSSLSQVRQYWSTVRDRRIADLFEEDRHRTDHLSLEVGDLFLDYSKTSLDGTSLSMLFELLAGSVFRERRQQMFEGLPVNNTENRPALHMALRGPEEFRLDGRDVSADTAGTLDRMAAMARRIREGVQAPQGGGRFTDVINIGIGGSGLGPEMATEALAPYADGPRIHHVSNVDGSQISRVVAGLDPRTTLVIVVSKTFRTVETLTNARTARSWIAGCLGEERVGERFIGVSSNPRETAAFGLSAESVFEFADWVGGRYSVWGPVGLSLMLAIGPEHFARFLAGAHDMDRHFRTARPQVNMPVLLGLTGIWHNQVCGYSTRAILPYDQRLARLPAYLQQLEMESNGKSVALDGRPLQEHSAPVVWGEPGTNGQHAFHQMLHQGTRIVPCEFLVAASGHEAGLRHHHDILLANCLAQSRALMAGNQSNTPAVSLPRRCPGNRPSTTLVLSGLTPSALGQLIALYEHRVFVEGAILGINSFDQWGVELGKEIARGLVGSVAAGSIPDDVDASTRRLLQFINGARSDGGDSATSG